MSYVNRVVQNRIPLICYNKKAFIYVILSTVEARFALSTILRSCKEFCLCFLSIFNTTVVFSYQLQTRLLVREKNRWISLELILSELCSLVCLLN